MEAIQIGIDKGTPVQTELDRIVSELHHYRSQTDRLQKMNDLYRRLAGITDLPAMIESYSIWLSQYVPHEIIGYNNLTRERKHMFCSSHGPHRRQVIKLADQLLRQDDAENHQCAECEGFYSHTWTLKDVDSVGILILLRKDHQIPAEELGLISDSLSVLAEPLSRVHDYEEIYHQARVDSLTGLPNRRVLDERIDNMIERARRHKRPLTLASLDLDHFKDVNDCMGHLYGDKVLKQVARTLQQQIRRPDLLVRMGGDELLLILADTDLSEARYLAERLSRAVSDLDIKAGKGKLGISIGLSQWQQGMSRQEWLERADDILYQAKKGGRNQVAH